MSGWCRRHLPDATITVCEIDPAVIALRDESQIPPDDERLEVLLVDGATYLATWTDKLDLILVDAFDRDGLSRAVMTDTFFRDARECLAAGGTFVMNAVDSLVLGRPCIDGMRAALARPIVPVSIPVDGNLLLFGCESLISPGIARRALGQAPTIRESLALTFPSMCRQLASILRNATPQSVT
jgi:spermidine synthase